MIDQLWHDDPARAFWRDWCAQMEQVQIARARELFQSLDATRRQTALREIKSRNLEVDQTIALLQSLS
jgi:hypothetical protein